MILTGLPARLNDAYQRHGAPILALCLIKLTLIYLAFVAGFRILSNDESCRWHMANGWIAAPYFAPWDHVWPGGYFYLAGSWMWLFGPSFVAAKMLPIALTMLAAGGLYMAATLLFQSRISGFVAALLCLGGYVNTWISMAIMPEIMAISVTSWGVYFAFRGLLRESGRSLALGSFILGLTASFRYEQWFLLAAWQVILLIVLIMEPRKWWRWIILSGFLSSSYIIAWMTSSWLRYGNPIQFFEQSRAVTEVRQGNPVVEMFGHLMWWEGLIFKFAFVAQIAMIAFGNRAQRLYGLWILGFGILFIASLKVGTAAATWRIVQGWRCCLVLMIPILFRWALEDRFAGALKHSARALALGAALLYAVTQTPYSLKPPAWEFRKDTLAFGDWLLFEQFEYAAGRPEFFKERGFDHILLQGVGDPSEDYEDFWALAYFLGNPGLMRVDDATVVPEANVILTKRTDTPTGWTTGRQFGDWRVLVPEAPAAP